MSASYVEAYRGVDFRQHPDLYRVGRGEQGVLVAEPYKSELLPLWRFRTPEIATQSARALLTAFRSYKKLGDFVGMDMARKYLQMGFTRARRYANHRSGTKYGKDQRARARPEREALPLDPDDEKGRAATVFYAAWQRVERDRTYRRWVEAQRATERGGTQRAPARPPAKRTPKKQRAKSPAAVRVKPSATLP